MMPKSYPLIHLIEYLYWQTIFLKSEGYFLIKCPKMAIEIFDEMCKRGTSMILAAYLAHNLKSWGRYVWFSLLPRAMLSIFYGRRVLRLAQIVPDKKKGLSAFFLFFLRHCSKAFLFYFLGHIAGIFCWFSLSKTTRK